MVQNLRAYFILRDGFKKQLLGGGGLRQLKF